MGRIVIPAAMGGLVLRQLTQVDARPLRELAERNIDQIRQYVGSEEISQYQFRLCASVRIEEQCELRLGIWHNTDLVGFIRLTPKPGAPWNASLGYWLGAEYVGNGYATQAVIALTQYAFDTTAALYLFGFVRLSNFKSKHVLERSGYQVVRADSMEMALTTQKQRAAE